MLRSIVLAVPLVFALVSCNNQSAVAPSSIGNGSPPELGTGSGPANPGHSFVFRSQDGIFLSSVDEAQGLVVRHYNTEDADFCGGNTPTPTAEAQLVFTPGGAIYVWKTGVIPVYVYRLSEVPPQEASRQFCKDLKAKWIYRGTHELKNHDNNLFFDPTHTDAFGFTGQGTVFDRAGAQFSYYESLLAVIDPVQFRELNAKYTLTFK
jgi:hypothetical protein